MYNSKGQRKARIALGSEIPDTLLYDIWVKPTNTSVEWYQVQDGAWELVLTEACATFQFPIGAVYLNVTGTNPATELGYGTWSQIAQGQFLAGYKSGDADFGTIEGTGSSKTASLERNNAVNSQSILNPYCTICVWKRTA